jgi:hypothetical protein
MAMRVTHSLGYCSHLGTLSGKKKRFHKTEFHTFIRVPPPQNGDYYVGASRLPNIVLVSVTIPLNTKSVAMQGHWTAIRGHMRASQRYLDRRCIAPPPHLPWNSGAAKLSHASSKGSNCEANAISVEFQLLNSFESSLIRISCCL